jgi:adenylosuccinate synthase
MQKQQEIKIVLGALFGDEGKGNVVQWLCKQAIQDGKKPIVIRFCGGPQAGHRVVHNGMDHVCSTFGSGSLLDVPTFYAGTRNCFIDPISLKKEKETLISKGLNPQLFVAGQPTIITPYDVLAGIHSTEIMTNGSCGKGIYPAFVRRNTKPMMCDLGEIADFWELGREKVTEDLYKESLKEYIRDNVVSEKIIADYDVLIFEGTQGLLLDKNRGFMPHCTPSNVGLNGIHQSFLGSDTEVYLVTRTYTTRHGNGYEPKFEEKVKEYFNLYEPTNLDTGYQGKFKVGVFEVPLLLRAFDRHVLDNYNVKYNLVITHVDCLKDTDCLPYVSAYNYFDVQSLDCMVADINEYSCIKFERILPCSSEEM